MNNRGMKIGSFIQYIKDKANSAIKSNLALRPNYLEEIMEALFPSRYTRQFKKYLYSIRKTGNVVDLLGLKNLFDLDYQKRSVSSLSYNNKQVVKTSPLFLLQHMPAGENLLRI